MAYILYAKIEIAQRSAPQDVNYFCCLHWEVISRLYIYKKTLCQAAVYKGDVTTTTISCVYFMYKAKGQTLKVELAHTGRAFQYYHFRMVFKYVFENIIISFMGIRRNSLKSSLRTWQCVGKCNFSEK